MEKVVSNIGIPHVAEQIFEGLNTHELFKCLEVSETWNNLAGNVLIKRLKGRMFEACKYGETKVVQILLERCNSEESGLNTRDKDGGTPFMKACLYGHKNVVQLLLDSSDKNVELNASDKDGWTALMWACYYGRKDVVHLLLDHSTQSIVLDAEDYGGNTALTIACQRGHRDIEQLLIGRLFRHQSIEVPRSRVALRDAGALSEPNSSNRPGAQIRKQFRKRLGRLLERTLRLLTRAPLV